MYVTYMLHVCDICQTYVGDIRKRYVVLVRAIRKESLHFAIFKITSHFRKEKSQR